MSSFFSWKKKKKLEKTRKQENSIIDTFGKQDQTIHLTFQAISQPYIQESNLPSKINKSTNRIFSLLPSVQPIIQSSIYNKQSNHQLFLQLNIRVYCTANCLSILWIQHFNQMRKFQSFHPKFQYRKFKRILRTSLSNHILAYIYCWNCRIQHHWLNRCCKQKLIGSCNNCNKGRISFELNIYDTVDNTI
jgi:hypothetical protein